MNQHPLKNVVLEFDLPFVLRVIDSMRPESIPEGYEQYVALVNGMPMMMRFEKKLRDLGGIQIATEDRRGLLNYSTVQVWFDKTFLKSFNIEENYRPQAKILFAFALEGVNRFLELYRRETDSFWIRRVKHSEVPIVKMIGRRWDGTEDPFTTGTLGTGLGLGSLISTDQDQSIRKKLLSEETPDELERFAYLVEALFDQEDFWAAALAAEIHFEATLARLLRSAFAAAGVPEAEIDTKFENKDGFPRSITNLINTYVSQLTGVRVDDPSTKIGKAYQQWAMMLAI